MHAELACLCDEGEALDADDIADVEKLFPDGVVHRLVLARADFVTLDINLDPAGAVLQLAEGGGAHYAAAHEPAGYAYFLIIALLRVVSGRDFSGRGVDRVFGCRIRLYPQLSELGKRLPAQKFLFTIFHTAKVL